MSITYCHKQQPQPWMSYISPSKIVFNGECCPALVTGRNCFVETFEDDYGFLYNWYAVVDLRNICAEGWHVVTHDESVELMEYLDPSGTGLTNIAGGMLKEAGTEYWDSPNTGATNEMGFNGRGAGYRIESTGAFNYLKLTTVFWHPEEYELDANYGYSSQLLYNSASFRVDRDLLTSVTRKNAGRSVRICRSATAPELLLADGTSCDPYIGNDNRSYRTVKINDKVWIADNLRETEYRTGASIQEVSDAASWITLDSGARCSYVGDEVCGQSLLPFQVISNGAFIKMEYSPYGENNWTEIDIPVTSVMTDGFFIHSYNGEPLESELPCRVYEFKLTAGEMWYFEPIMIEDFDIITNEFSLVDELMIPFKITERIIDTTPLIAPCDRILPFMFRTDNVTSGSIVVTMVDSDGAETALTITVQTGVIDGKTYYWHRGECLYPFLICGTYYLKIVDGANTYYSVPFVPECGISDIPDGNEALIDVNGCVMRDTDGNILYEPC